MSDVVVTEVRGPLLVITLNRPEALNAINTALANQLLAALERLNDDPDLLVGVLTGSGRGFCSGMDLREFQSHGTPPELATILKLTRVKPLVAAVEGFAVAGGLELALCCDLLVAGRGARFGIPEVKVGQVAWLAISRLQRALPRQAVAEMALTGNLIESDRAWDLGLLTRLVDSGEALASAIDLAEQISRNAPLSIAATLHLLDESHRGSDLEYATAAVRISATLASAQDAIEGSRAFTERREPKWKGC